MVRPQRNARPGAAEAEEIAVSGGELVTDEPFAGGARADDTLVDGGVQLGPRSPQCGEGG